MKLVDHGSREIARGYRGHVFLRPCRPAAVGARFPNWRVSECRTGPSAGRAYCSRSEHREQVVGLGGRSPQFPRTTIVRDTRTVACGRLDAAAAEANRPQETRCAPSLRGAADGVGHDRATGAERLRRPDSRVLCGLMLDFGIELGP